MKSSHNEIPWQQRTGDFVFLCCFSITVHVIIAIIVIPKLSTQPGALDNLFLSLNTMLAPILAFLAAGYRKHRFLIFTAITWTGLLYLSSILFKDYLGTLNIGYLIRGMSIAVLSFILSAAWLLKLERSKKICDQDIERIEPSDSVRH